MNDFHILCYSLAVTGIACSGANHALQRTRRERRGIIAVPVPTNQPSWRLLVYIRTDLGRLTEAMRVVAFMIVGLRDTFLDRKSYELRSVLMEN